MIRIPSMLLLAGPLLAPTSSPAQEPAAAPRFRMVAEVEPLPGPAVDFAVAADGGLAVTSGDDGRVVVWDVSAGRVLWSKVVFAGKHPLIGISPDGEVVAVQVPHTSDDGFRAYTTRTGAELTGWQTIPLGTGSRREDGRGGSFREGPELHLHPRGATIFHPSDYRHLIVSSRRKLDPPPVQSRRRWRISPDGDQVAVCTVQGLVGGRIPQGHRQSRVDLRIHQLPTGREVARLQWDELLSAEWPHPADCMGIDFRGRRVALARDGSVTVFGFDRTEELYRFGSAVTALVHRGGLWITGHRDGRVRGIAGGDQVFEVPALDGAVDWLKVHGERAERVVAFRTWSRYAVIGRDAAAPATQTRVLVRDEAAMECRIAGEHIVFRDHRTLRVRTAAAPVCDLPAVQKDPIYPEEDRRNVPVRVRRGRLFFLRGGVLRVHDLAANRAVAALSAHKAALWRTAWTDPGHLAVIGFERSALLDPTGRQVGPVLTHRWGMPAGDRLLDPQRHSGLDPWRASPCVSDDGRRWALRDGDRLRVLDVATGEEVFGRADFGGKRGALALGPRGVTFAATRPLDRTRTRLALFDLRRGDEVGGLDLACRNVEDLVFDRTGRFLAVQTPGLTLVLDLNGRVVHEVSCGPATKGEVAGRRPFAFTPDGNRFVSARFSGEVQVYDLRERRVASSFSAPQETYSHFVEVRMSPAGDTFALGYRERELVYWVSVAKGLAHHARIHLPGGGDSGFLPDGRLVAVDGRGGQLWDPATMRRIAEFPELAGAAVQVAPDGGYLAITRGSAVRFFAAGK